MSLAQAAARQALQGQVLQSLSNAPQRNGAVSKTQYHGFVNKFLKQNEALGAK